MNGISARTLHMQSTAGESLELKANSEAGYQLLILQDYITLYNPSDILQPCVFILIIFFNSSIVLPLSSPSSNEEELSKVECRFAVGKK